MAMITAYFTVIFHSWFILRLYNDTSSTLVMDQC